MSSNYEVSYYANLLDLCSEHCDSFILLGLKIMFVKKKVFHCFKPGNCLEWSENDAPNEIDDMWEDTELQDDCSPLTSSNDDSALSPSSFTEDDDAF